MDIRIEYHSPDQVFAAVFMRDGEPWYLNGALVGMDDTPDTAVKELIELGQYLVVNGENFLTEGQIPLADRKWLFALLDVGSDFEISQAMYAAIRQAES